MSIHNFFIIFQHQKINITPKGFFFFHFFFKFDFNLNSGIWYLSILLTYLFFFYDIFEGSLSYKK